MNKQDIRDRAKKIADEQIDNFHPPFHSSEYTDWSKPPNIPLGNIPELKIIELLKDIKILLVIIIGLLGIIASAVLTPLI